MHANRLVEVAGLLGLRAPLLVRDTPICADALSEYWIASRCRLDAWGRTLRTLAVEGTPTDSSAESGNEDLLSQLSVEITLSSPLSHVVAAICHAHDMVTPATEASSIGENLLEGHHEVTSRLRALTFARWPPDSPRVRQAGALNRQAAQWTDVLLAYLCPVADVEQFAIDSARLREFAYDSQLHGSAASAGAPQLLLYALRSAFAGNDSTPLAGDLNRRIAGAALALFGDAAFDGHGLACPAWMVRADRVSSEALGLVERLFADGPEESAFQAPARWRI